ncbi:MAG: type II toxin-antitoxin system HicB family antitoxin [Parcubacteria group bacterium]|nr:type II toxin-antitoxin system HicB family antitoxin [Parcubacteria group bacterium]
MTEGKEVLDDLLSREYPVTIRWGTDESTGCRYCLVRHPDLEGCYGLGRSLKDALADVKRARLDWFNEALRDNRTIPPPSEPPEDAIRVSA